MLLVWTEITFNRTATPSNLQLRTRNCTRCQQQTVYIFKYVAFICLMLNQRKSRHSSQCYVAACFPLELQYSVFSSPLKAHAQKQFIYSSTSKPHPFSVQDSKLTSSLLHRRFLGLVFSEHFVVDIKHKHSVRARGSDLNGPIWQSKHERSSFLHRQVKFLLKSTRKRAQFQDFTCIEPVFGTQLV